MINYSILKQASTQDPNNVVKVAGVVRRLMNWFKQLSNEEYREQIENLKNESATIQAYMRDLSKELDKLNNAIKDADVTDYEVALEDVKHLCGLLHKELENLHSIATVSTIENKKDEEPAIINKSNKDRFGSLEVFISDQAKLRFLQFLSNDVSEQIRNSPHFFNLFGKAIKSGTVTKEHPVKKNNREEQKYLTVQFGPFSVPGINYVFRGTVLINEIPQQKLSLMRTLSVDYDEINEKKSSQLRKKLLKKIAFQDGRTERFTNVLSPVKLAEVLRIGYRNVFGKDPTLQTLGTGWAQAMIESSGRTMNNNIGNITAGDSWIKSGKPYLVLQTENEKKNGLKEFGPSGEVLTHLKQLKFRSYRSPEEGAADYWRLLSKYGKVLDWFGTGDALHSGLALGDKTYYTANRFLYSGAMSKLYNRFIKEVAPNLSGIESNPQPPPEKFPEYKPWKNSKPQAIPQNLVANIEKNTGYTVQQNSGLTQAVGLNTPNNLENNEEIDNFMNYLFASPLNDIVKKAIEEKILNKTTVKINMNSNECHQNVCSFIKDCFDSDVKINNDNSLIFSVLGDDHIVVPAVANAISAFADTYYNKNNIKIKFSVEVI